MTSLLKRFCVGVLLALPFFASGEHINHANSQVFGDLDIIKNAFQVSYAPAEWKMKYSGWELDAEIEKAKSRILSTPNLSIKEYQRIVRDFLNSTKDYHVRVLFYSTEKASLPFRVKGANGKYYLSHIDRNKLSAAVFPFAEGDELLLFGGRPVHEVINEFKENEMGYANESTDQALAEIYLTNRAGILGHVVPKGPITITVIPNGSSKSLSYQLIWNYKPEKVAAPPQSKTLKVAHSKSQKTLKTPKSAKKQSLLQNDLIQKLLLAPQYEDILQLNNGDGLPSEFLGSKTSFIPVLGRIWWKSPETCPFEAYLFELNDRKIAGYIRIPSYIPEGLNDVSEFASIISILQERSDVLVIDQLDNPGGSAFYLYALASMLTEEPLITPKHRMTITQAEVYLAQKYIPLFEAIQSDSDAQEVLGEDFEGIPVTHQMAQFFLNYFRFIVEEWNAGRQFTEPFYLYGIDHINPDPQVRYTKPILVLVNSMDFSGGDFFPAILQDNCRATILGTRTAGAGGFIRRLQFPNLHGIAEVRFTGSIAERADKNPIENLGVTPDIPYEISENDLQYNYIEYTKKIKETLENLLDNRIIKNI